MQFLAHIAEQFLEARPHHLGEHLPRQMAGRRFTDTGHVERRVVGDQLRQRAAVADLDRLGVLGRRAESHRDVAGDQVASDRDHRRVANRTALVDRDVAGAAADVDQADAEIALVRRQHRVGRRQVLKHETFHRQPAALDALVEVLRGRKRAGHHVDLGFQAHAGHTDRVLNAFLAVDHVFLRHHMQDLLIGRDRHRARRFDHRIDIARSDFAVADRDHADRVQGPDMAAGDADVCCAHPAVGHQLGGFDGAADRIDGVVDVDHHALLETARRRGAETDHLHRAGRRHFTDHRGHLRRTDVEADQVLGLSVLAHQCVVPSAGLGEVLASGETPSFQPTEKPFE